MSILVSVGHSNLIACLIRFYEQSVSISHLICVHFFPQRWPPSIVDAASIRVMAPCISASL